MIRADPKECIVRKQIEKIDFGFYTDQDVRARSICEVTSPQALDPMGSALPNGLYDPRMGPSNPVSPPCPTCACHYLQCPGHFGHLELCVPVYHPLLLDKILTLLRVKCWNCHKLRAASRVLQVYQVKFALLEQGAYHRVTELDDYLTAAMKSRHAKEDGGGEGGGGQSSMLKAVTALDEVLEDCRREIRLLSATSGHHHRHELSVLEQNLHRELQQSLLTSCKGAKVCPHCGAHSPKIRQDSANKFFQAPLTDSAKRINEAEGIILEPALKGSVQSTIIEEEEDEDSVDNTSDDEAAATKGKRKTSGGGRDKFLHPAEVQAQLKKTWETTPDLCEELFAKQGPSVFFLQAIAVPPNRFRPPMGLGGMVVEHSQNFYLSKILVTNENVRNSFTSNTEAIAYKHWIDLQTHVNCFMDSSKDPSLNQNAPVGIRQLLERKEGIFRKHMMGKRVDYACRSVISPDPYVGTNEIGIPRHFAVTLTYPTPVTDINIQEMRKLVERGPNNYPGARWVEFPDRRVDLSKMDQHKREAVAARMLSHAKMGGKPAIVGRQLRDGDMVLMNRQPTLHKPGIMAHEVRVLHNPTQKTIRMHYANCNTYNADFDGDEMNCHFPQSDLGRAEAKFIAQTDLQFIVPTDGSPLRGLIQDHVVGGVKLTKKDTFLNREEYQQLLFAALASLPRLELIRSNADIELLPPAIIKPRELWTGKQVISTLLNHLRKGNDRDGTDHEAFPGLSTERKTKTPASAFGEEHEEHLVLIRDGELLRGVLDKASFGATDFSLVHAVYEAYGPSKAGLLLNALGRLFTAYIQFYHGHSCRMEDLILTAKSDDERRALVQRAYNVGSRAAQAWANSDGGKVPIESRDENRPLKPYENATAAAKVHRLLSGSEGKANAAAFDGYMMSKLNPLASDIVKKCLPNGLAVPFPLNSFGVMVTTGAKGSIVNQSQVTCALGQQALEGRRVPRLASGRTLPSFAPYDVNPRADGFVMDRFLTGIRPQEYYFHCMAGREGLVDTAVKTSRSGYLQRCLVKHLEELKICYDFTVRNGEGGVVQFLYGEDALDPTKASYLDCSDASFAYIARNYESLKRQNAALPEASVDASSDIAARAHALARATGVYKFKVGDFVKARKLRTGDKWKHGALCLGWYDAIVQRVKKDTVDIRYNADGKAVKGVPISVEMRGAKGLSNVCTLVKAASPDPILSSSNPLQRLGSNGGCISERVAEATTVALKESSKLKEAMRSRNLDKDALGSLVAAKYGASLCAPGEAVGSIAAQSVGEPSTQMTLNTFHLAGAGANVTLGIPRLREIIMTASRELKTPTMSAPLHEHVSDKDAVRLTRYFQRLNLIELIAGHHGIAVDESIVETGAGNWERAYSVRLKFHPAERIKEAFDLTLDDIAEVVAKTFVPALSREMKLELRRSAAEGESSNLDVGGGEAAMYQRPSKNSKKTSDDDDAQESSGLRDSSATPDLFGDDDDDDDADESDNEAGEEDGVAETRTQAEGYGAADEDEKVNEADNASMSDASSRQEKQDDDDYDDDDEVGAEMTASSAYSNELKVDEKRNSLVLPTLRVDPSARPLLMVGLVEKAAQKTIVRARKSIDQAFVNTEENGRGRCLQTAGINFTEMWELDSIDHDRLMSNDIWAVRCAYGVEAARNTIVDQIRSVFGAYGIEVDARHLSLIADYMTYGGDYTAMNRIGMRDAMSSPFLQMSFETTAQFLTQAAVATRSDSVKSPSSNIVVGRPIRHGTGAFSLLAK